MPKIKLAEETVYEYDPEPPKDELIYKLIPPESYVETKWYQLLLDKVIEDWTDASDGKTWNNNLLW